MSVLIVPETAEAAERRKWEAQYSPYGPGERPYLYREFPLMLHKAGKPLDANGDPKMGAPDIIDRKEVSSLDEETRENAHGFYRDPAEAVRKFEAQQVEIAKLAAEMNWDVKNRLSPQAGAEVEAARERHPGHMPMMPVTPIKRRGRPSKKAATAAGD